MNRQFKYSSLAVSGLCCTGKSTICRTISSKLKWTHIDVGSEFRRIANSQGLRIEEFGSISDTELRYVDDQIKQRIESEEYRIWDGRLTCYLARANTKVLKVYCIADINVRVERCARRDSVPLEDAWKKVLARDIEEREVFDRLYGVSNPYSPAWVNLSLDTSSHSPEALTSFIVQELYT